MGYEQPSPAERERSTLGIVELVGNPLGCCLLDQMQRSDDTHREQRAAELEPEPAQNACLVLTRRRNLQI